MSDVDEPEEYSGGEYGTDIENVDDDREKDEDLDYEDEAIDETDDEDEFDYELEDIFLWAETERSEEMKQRVLDIGLKPKHFTVERVVAKPAVNEAEKAKPGPTTAEELFRKDVLAVSRLPFDARAGFKSQLFPERFLSDVRQQEFRLVTKEGKQIMGKKRITMEGGQSRVVSIDREGNIVKGTARAQVRFRNAKGKKISMKKFEKEIRDLFKNLSTGELKKYKRAAERHNARLTRKKGEGKLVMEGETVDTGLKMLTDAEMRRLQEETVDAESLFRRDAIAYVEGRHPSELFLRNPPTFKTVEVSMFPPPETYTIEGEPATVEEVEEFLALGGNKALVVRKKETEVPEGVVPLKNETTTLYQFDELSSTEKEKNQLTLEGALLYIRTLATEDDMTRYKNEIVRILEQQTPVKPVKIKLLGEQYIDIPRGDIVNPKLLAYNEEHPEFQIGVRVEFVATAEETLNVFVLRTLRDEVVVLNPITDYEFTIPYANIVKSVEETPPVPKPVLPVGSPDVSLPGESPTHDVYTRVTGKRITGKIYRRPPVHILHPETYKPGVKIAKELKKKKKGLELRPGVPKDVPFSEKMGKRDPLALPKAVPVTLTERGKVQDVRRHPVQTEVVSYGKSSRLRKPNLLNDIIDSMHGPPSPKSPSSSSSSSLSSSSSSMRSSSSSVEPSYAEKQQRYFEEAMKRRQELERERAKLEMENERTRIFETQSQFRTAGSNGEPEPQVKRTPKGFTIKGREKNGLKPGSFYKIITEVFTKVDQGNIVDFSPEGVVIVSDSNGTVLFRGYDDENLRIVPAEEKPKFEVPLSLDALVDQPMNEKVRDMVSRMLADAMDLPKTEIPDIQPITLSEFMKGAMIEWWTEYTRDDRIAAVDVETQRKLAKQELFAVQQEKEALARKARRRTITKDEKQRLADLTVNERSAQFSEDALTEAKVKLAAEQLLKTKEFQMEGQANVAIFYAQKGAALRIEYAKYLDKLKESRTQALFAALNTETVAKEKKPETAAEYAQAAVLESLVKRVPIAHPKAVSEFHEWIAASYEDAVKTGMTIRKYMSKMARVLVLLIDLKNEAVFFNARVRDGLYSPKEFSQLSLSQMFPELTGKYLVDHDKAALDQAIDLFRGIKYRRVRSMQQDYFSLVNVSSRRQWVTSIPNEKHILKYYLLPLNDKKFCPDPTKRVTDDGTVEDVPADDLTICYDRETKTFTCMSIRDAILNVTAGRPNPHTGRPYPKDFVERILLRYSSETREPLKYLAEPSRISRPVQDLKVKSPTVIKRFIVYASETTSETVESLFEPSHFTSLLETGHVIFRYSLGDEEKSSDPIPVVYPRIKGKRHKGDAVIVATSPLDPLPDVGGGSTVYITLFSSNPTSQELNAFKRKAKKKYKDKFVYVLYRPSATELIEKEALFTVWANNNKFKDELSFVG